MIHLNHIFCQEHMECVFDKVLHDQWRLNPAKASISVCIKIMRNVVCVN